MKELSLNILDIAQNSVKANASLIGITVCEKGNILTIEITDDGCGMTEEQLYRLKDPFFTTRTTRKVGLGIPFLTLEAEQTGGSVEITSRSASEYPDSHGTRVFATFYSDNIDFTPLGDIVSTVITLLQSAGNVDYEFRHETERGNVTLSTREMREMLGDIPLSEPDVLCWASEYLASQYEEIKK